MSQEQPCVECGEIIVDEDNCLHADWCEDKEE